MARRDHNLDLSVACHWHPVLSMGLNMVRRGKLYTKQQWRDAGVYDGGWDDDSPSLQAWTFRQFFVSAFSWAVPSEEAVRFVASHGPLHEVMAGNGFWAEAIRRVAGDVNAITCSDDFSWKGQTRRRHGPVSKMKAGRAVRVLGKDRTILMCWPHMDPGSGGEDVVDALAPGQKLIYIGEREGGCCGSDAFWLAASLDLEEVGSFPLPQWWGIRDRIIVFQKAGAT